MKVICIDASDAKFLVEGDVYTVYEEDDTTFNKPAYFLEEIDVQVSPLKAPYDKDRFIPTSDIDETELIREKELIEA